MIITNVSSIYYVLSNLSIDFKMCHYFMKQVSKKTKQKILKINHLPLITGYRSIVEILKCETQF